MCKVCDEIKAKKSFSKKEVKEWLDLIGSKKNVSHFDEVLNILLSINDVEDNKELDEAWEKEYHGQ